MTPSNDQIRILEDLRQMIKGTAWSVNLANDPTGAQRFVYLFTRPGDDARWGFVNPHNARKFAFGIDRYHR